MTLIRTAFVALTAVASLAAQQTRDAATPERRGTGTIDGVIVSASEPRTPLRQVHVTLTASQPVVSRLVITNETGRFRFADLPAGRYRLSATKAAWLPTEYGAKRPGGTGISLVLADGQTATGITLVLHKGAVIAGRVTDESGAPAPGRYVTARRVTSTASTVPFTGAATTDARGEYRIFGLRPASYRVSVDAVVGATEALSTDEIDAALLPRGAAAPARPRQIVAAVPIFYPSTPVEEQASVVAVQAGDERTDVDIRLTMVLASTIAGTVIGPDGAPARGVSVRLLGPGAQGVRPTSTSSDPSTPGTFLLTGVPPGEFTVLASVSPPVDDSPFMAVVQGSSPLVTGPLNLWATSTVTPAGQDIEGLVLVLRPGLTVAGRLVFDAATTPPPPASGWRVAPVGEFVRTGMPAIRPPDATTAANGVFTISGIVPGRYRMRAASLSQEVARSWFVRSIVHEGREIGDAWFDLGEDIRDIIVTVSDRAASLRGTLTGPAGLAAPDYFIIVFPADRERWYPGSQRIQAVRPGTDGRFTVTNVAAGEYLVAAVTDVEQGEWFDSAFLEQLVPAAIRVTLVEGETTTQDLRVAGGGGPCP